MTRRAAQLNIRSDAARARVAELIAETGKSATQVVEEALQSYRPPPLATEVIPGDMIRKGKFLVFKADGRVGATMAETLAAIDEDRNRELFYG